MLAVYVQTPQGALPGIEHEQVLVLNQVIRYVIFIIPDRKVSGAFSKEENEFSISSSYVRHIEAVWLFKN